MRRSCRINDVVPVVVRLVKDHLPVKPGQESVLNLSSCLLDLADDSRKHLQAGLCCGVGGSYACIFGRKQRGSAPGMSYLEKSRCSMGLNLEQYNSNIVTTYFLSLLNVVSIHAPRVGGDKDLGVSYAPADGFQSTPPRGGRLLFVYFYIIQVFTLYIMRTLS